MISTSPFFNLIEERAALNIKPVVQYLRKTTNNTVLVKDDGYYASYAVPMTDKSGQSQQVNVLLDFSRLHFGGTRYWLVCEHCHKKVVNLYVASNTLACRHCLGLDYASRIYARSPLLMSHVRYKKAAELFATRRLNYAGKPTRAGRRLSRLVNPSEFVGVVEDLLSVK